MIADHSRKAATAGELLDVDALNGAICLRILGVRPLWRIEIGDDAGVEERRINLGTLPSPAPIAGIDMGHLVAANPASYARSASAKPVAMVAPMPPRSRRWGST